MNVPIEISFRDGMNDDEIAAFAREHALSLERYNDHISSCRIAIEKPNQITSDGSPYRVRLDITVPPKHELVSKREPGDGDRSETVYSVIREVFADAERQLKKLNDRQEGEEKTHPQQQTTGLVSRLYDDHGFLTNLEGEEVYFHQNAVLGGDFDRLTVGTGVHFSQEMGENGPQASTVRVVDKPGERIGK